MNQVTRDPEIHNPGHLSWDAILFLLLWAAHFWSSESANMIFASRENNVSLVVFLTRIFSDDPLPGLLLLILALYIGADLWSKGRTQFVIKLAAVLVLVLFVVIVPLVAAMAYRHAGVPYLYVHDGAIQIEEAIKFLLAGKNPYAENYALTPMAQWPFHEGELSVNPGLYFLAYLPMTIFLSLPFYFLSQLTVGWYDQRIVYLALFVTSSVMVVSAGSGPRQKLAALMAWTLNPLFVPFFIEGRNDILVSFFLLAGILLAQRGRLGAASIAIAFAAGSKQTAWFVLPFFFLFVMRSGSFEKLATRAKALVPGAIAFALIVVPFLLWDARSFMADVISYASGFAAAASYPVKSLGLGSLLLGFHWLQPSIDAFPFSWLQLGLGGMVTLILLYLQWRNNSIRQMVLNYALLLFIIFYFSRTFNDNHLGFLLTWLILPSFLKDSQSTVMNGIGPTDAQHAQDI